MDQIVLANSPACFKPFQFKLVSPLLTSALSTQIWFFSTKLVLLMNVVAITMPAAGQIQ
jgi:hypothetical protein